MTLSADFENVKNAIKDTIAHSIEKGEIKADEHLIAARRDICEKCPFVKKVKRLKCGKCGCFLRLKTFLIAQKCPMGFW